MELKDLVGNHLLSGLDQVTVPKKEEWEYDSAALLVILGGITYKATEDPSDGYRSYLRSLETTDEKVSYTFPPHEVVGKMKDPDEYEDGSDVIQFFDAKTGKLVLEFGTANVDDYYPCCVLSWYPKNLLLNNQQELERSAATKPDQG